MGAGISGRAGVYRQAHASSGRRETHAPRQLGQRIPSLQQLGGALRTSDAIPWDPARWDPVGRDPTGRDPTRRHAEWRQAGRNEKRHRSQVWSRRRRVGIWRRWLWKVGGEREMIR